MSYCVPARNQGSLTTIRPIASLYNQALKKNGWEWNGITVIYWSNTICLFSENFLLLICFFFFKVSLWFSTKIVIGSPEAQRGEIVKSHGERPPLVSQPFQLSEFKCGACFQLKKKIRLFNKYVKSYSKTSAYISAFVSILYFKSFPKHV